MKANSTSTVAAGISVPSASRRFHATLHATSPTVMQASSLILSPQSSPSKKEGKMVIVAWSGGRPLPVLFEALLNDSEGKKNFVPACGETPLLQNRQREMPQKKKVNSTFHSHKCKQHVPHRCGPVPCPAKIRNLEKSFSSLTPFCSSPIMIESMPYIYLHVPQKSTKCRYI